MIEFRELNVYDENPMKTQEEILTLIKKEKERYQLMQIETSASYWTHLQSKIDAIDWIIFIITQ